jgi:hypothetical protein
MGSAGWKVVVAGGTSGRGDEVWAGGFIIEGEGSLGSSEG